MSKYAVGALTGETENGERYWTEQEFRTRRKAFSQARDVSKICGTSIVAKVDKGEATPVVRFSWGREMRYVDE